MKDKITIVVFVALVFGITAWSLAEKPKAFSEKENRYLAEQPEFSLDALWDGSFTKEYETFITDQFPIRDQWIGFKTAAERLRLRQDGNGVYFGRDGYLIGMYGRDVFESTQARKNVASLAEFVKGQAESFTPEHLQVLLVPTASQVLKGKLPAFAAPYDQGEFVAQVKEQMPEEYLLYAEPALAEHSDEYVYYRTDHHWTALGAFYAYQEWCGAAGIPAYTAGDFTVEEASEEFYGTLDSKVNTKVDADSMYLYHLKEGREYALEYDRDGEIRDSLYDYSVLGTKDKYRVYLGGNYGEVDIHTSLANGRTLLVVKDSFAHSFVPFAVNHYERVLMVDLRYFNMPISEYIEENGVTDILVLYNLANLAEDKNLGKIVR